MTRILTASDETNPSSEKAIRITTVIDRITREQDHHISHTRVDLGNGGTAMTMHDYLQRRDKIHPSRISAVNPDQSHLILQCLTDLETKTRTKLYRRTRNSHLRTTVTSQT